MLSKSTSGDYLYSHLDSARESEVIPGGFGGQSPPHQTTRSIKCINLVEVQPARSPARSPNNQPNRRPLNETDAH